jgi:hypothetical protein
MKKKVKLENAMNRIQPVQKILVFVNMAPTTGLLKREQRGIGITQISIYSKNRS